MDTTSNCSEAGQKRQRVLSDDFLEPQNWDRFFVISGADERFKRMSAIAISNSLKELLGQPDDARRLADRSMLVKTGNINQSQKLMGLKVMNGVNVTVQPHRTLNTCKGTIVSRESHTCSDTELREWLENENIIDIKRIPLRQEPLQLLILTFHSSRLPQKVPIGFEWCRVRTYIPNPRRCFNCQRYGHVTRTCRGQQRCSQCSSSHHVHTTESPCTLDPLCVNCGKKHPSFDKSCPVWIREKEVQKLKVEKDISFPQARRLVDQTSGPVTYKSVVMSSPKVRNTPRTRVDLDSHHSYSKHSNSQTSEPSQPTPSSQMSTTSSQPTPSNQMRASASQQNTNDMFGKFDKWLADNNKSLPQKKTITKEQDSNADGSSMEELSSQTVGVTEGSTSTVPKKVSPENSRGNQHRSLTKLSTDNTSTPRNTPSPGAKGGQIKSSLDRSMFKNK